MEWNSQKRYWYKGNKVIQIEKGFFIAGDKIGFEYVFALLLMALYLVINGGGELSVDKKKKKKTGSSFIGKLLS